MPVAYTLEYLPDPKLAQIEYNTNGLLANGSKSNPYQVRISNGKGGWYSKNKNFKNFKQATEFIKQELKNEPTTISEQTTEPTKEIPNKVSEEGVKDKVEKQPYEVEYRDKSLQYPDYKAGDEFIINDKKIKIENINKDGYKISVDGETLKSRSPKGAMDDYWQIDKIQKAINAGKGVPNNVIESLPDNTQQAISEGKIKSHPDYPELTKPRINLETSKSEALKLFAEGKTDREISNTLSLTGREGIKQVRDWRKEYAVNTIDNEAKSIGELKKKIKDFSMKYQGEDKLNVADDLGNYGELRGSSAEDCTHKTSSKYKPVSIQLPKERKKKELKFNLTQAIDMYISGMKVNQIAKQIGISQQLLNYHIQRYRSDVAGGSNV